MIRFATVSLGSIGVARCTRCDGGSPVPVSPEQAMSAMTTAASSGADGVVLVGFEPFTHPSLVELITAARALGVPRIGIQTDGAALAVGQNAPGSIGAGIRFFEFVFLGADESAHDRLAGRPGAYASLQAGIGAARNLSSPDQRIFVSAVICVCRHNADQFVSVVAAAVAAGARAIRVEITPGVDLLRSDADRAHAVATTAGVALFGDGCEHLLRGVPLYVFDDLNALDAAPSDGEETRG